MLGLFVLIIAMASARKKLKSVKKCTPRPNSFIQFQRGSHWLLRLLALLLLLFFSSFFCSCYCLLLQFNSLRRANFWRWFFSLVSLVMLSFYFLCFYYFRNIYFKYTFFVVLCMCVHLVCSQYEHTVWSTHHIRQPPKNTPWISSFQCLAFVHFH